MMRSNSNSNAKAVVLLLSVIALIATAVDATGSKLHWQKIVNADFSKGRQGFHYHDDTFRNTKQPNYARGKVSKKLKALYVQLGNVDNEEIWDMSGAWALKFKLSKATDVQITFDFWMFLSSSTKEGDFLDAMVSVDDKAFGTKNGTDYVAQIQGSASGRKVESGFKTVTINLGNYSKGDHVLKLGGFFLKKINEKAFGRIFYRNVMISIPGDSSMFPPADPTPELCKKDCRLVTQELQSPPSPRHSDGIVDVPPTGNKLDGSAVGLIWFANDLAVPNTGGFDGGVPMGTQTGHCVEVWIGKQLACYFRFAFDADEGKGTVTAEALFDLTNFPNAELTITGGTGDFMGIVGSGFTTAPEDFDGTTFFYTFDYKILD